MELEYGHWQDLRRRSTRPAAPPPSIPIPSLPPRAIRSSSFATPSAPTPLSMSSISDALSDPPPQSYLPAATSSSDRNQNRRSSLAPQNRSEHRPSSRRALTRALELAREAVQLDSTNDNPVAAVNAYAQSVALLSEVMERVRNGEDSTESNRRRQRRSISAQEKEVRRLQNIVCWFFSSRLEQLHSPVSILAWYLCRSNEYFEHHLQHSCSTLPNNITLCQYHNFYRLCCLQLPYKFNFPRLRYFSTSTTRSVSLLCPRWSSSILKCQYTVHSRLWCAARYLYAGRIGTHGLRNFWSSRHTTSIFPTIWISTLSPPHPT